MYKIDIERITELYVEAYQLSDVNPMVMKACNLGFKLNGTDAKSFLAVCFESQVLRKRIESDLQSLYEKEEGKPLLSVTMALQDFMQAWAISSRNINGETVKDKEIYKSVIDAIVTDNGLAVEFSEDQKNAISLINSTINKWRQLRVDYFGLDFLKNEITNNS